MGQRGSATLMALVAMLVLVVGAASVAYMSTGNVNIMSNYADGVEAQYAAESAVRLVYVTGVAAENPNFLPLVDSGTNEYGLKLPGVVPGSAKIRVNRLSTDKVYKIRSVASYKNVSRVAYDRNMDFRTGQVTDVEETYTEITADKLVKDAKSTWVSKGDAKWTPKESGSTVMLSPGYNDVGSNGWKNIYSAIFFNDSLGLDNFTLLNKLQLVFRVNYYITLVKVPGTGAGTGYGVYYLAPKYQPSDKNHSSAKNILNSACDPTAYVVQYDPGLNPTYDTSNLPKYGAWGAQYTDDNKQRLAWPYGAFLVKKTWWDGKEGAQTEVWDNSGAYHDHFAFQDNNELMQGYYQQSNPITLKIDTGLRNTDNALLPVVNAPAASPPTVTRVPTAFGLKANGTSNPPNMTGLYSERPPDLRLAYALGDIAEGNPWQANTYYPVGAKVAVGVWVDNALNKRLVWVAAKAGVSGGTKPNQLMQLPALGNTVADGGVIWEARKAPTPEEVANYVCAKGISIPKISMSDMKFRIDSVNGKNTAGDPEYSLPFSMLQGEKNKITIELWIDDRNNRVHIIRVNDVLALAFNDSWKSGKYNILPKGWYPGGSSQSFSTGLRVWYAAAEFYTKENYGQTLTTSTHTQHMGEWGR